MADNRQSKRTPVTLKIKFKSATLEQFIERYAVDVSHGGIFIRTKDPLPVGTTMRFEFQLKDATPLIKGAGTVVWTREHDPSRTGVAPGMGVRFDRLADGSREVLDQILARKANKTSSTGFTDQPTRVAPSPLVAGLAQQSGSGRSSSADFSNDRQGAGGGAMRFQSDVDEFPDEAFEEATKVRSMEDLAALTASEDVGADLTAMMRAADEAEAAKLPPAMRPDSEGPTRIVSNPLLHDIDPALVTASGLLDPNAEDPALSDRAATVPFGGKSLADIPKPKIASRSDEVPSSNILFGRGVPASKPEPPAANEPLPEESFAGILESTEDPDEPEALPPEPVTKKEPSEPLQLPDVPELGTVSSLPPALEALVAAGPAEEPPAAEPEVSLPPASAPPEPEASLPPASAPPEEPRKPARPPATVPPPVDELAERRARQAGDGKTEAKDETPKAATASDVPKKAPTVSRSESADSNRGLKLIALALVGILLALGAFLFLTRDTGNKKAPEAKAVDAGPPPVDAAPVKVPDAAPAVAIDASPPDAAVATPPPDAVMVDVRIDTFPRGVTAELVGTDQQGKTPATFKIAEGMDYQVRLSLDGYQTQELPLTSANPPKRLKMVQVPMLLRLQSEPPGGYVYIDGRRAKGATPTDFVLPASFRSKKKLKISMRLGGHEKLNMVIDNTGYQQDGDTMVLVVSGTFVPKTAGGAQRPKPKATGDGDKPAGGDGDAKPAGDGDEKPAGGSGEATEPSGPTPNWVNPS